MKLKMANSSVADARRKQHKSTVLAASISSRAHEV